MLGPYPSVLSITEIPAPTFQANSVVPRQVHPHVGKCLCRIVATEYWSHAKVEGTSKQRDAAREGAIGVRNVRRNVSDYSRNDLQLPAKKRPPASPGLPSRHSLQGLTAAMSQGIVRLSFAQ